MKSSWLLNDMLRICPQTGRIVEQEASVRTVQEAECAPFRVKTPRNAYVSFQIIVKTDLSEEASIGMDAPAALELYLEWFHKIGEAYIPDALVPWGQGVCEKSPFLLPSRMNQIPGQRYAAVWADMFIPEDLAPDTYRWNLTVHNGEHAESHELTVTVLPEIVPNEQTITADLNNYADRLSPQFGHLQGNEDRYTDGSYFALERQFYKMAHEHRALFHNLPYRHSGAMPKTFAPELAGSGKHMRVSDWSLFDEHFAPYLDGSAFKETRRGPIPVPFLYLPFNFHWPADYTKFGLKGYRTEFQAILRECYEHFTQMGWRDTTFELFLNHKKRYKLFPYDGDETRFMWDEKINDLFYDLAKDVLYRSDGARFAFRTDSSWAYGLHFAKYSGMIKLWVVNGNIFRWYPESADHLRGEGCTVWSYGSAMGLKDTLLGTAISPIACVARHIDGFNYWNTVEWGKEWHITPNSGGRTCMFYPGDKLFGILGPIPSIRLKVLRNAQQVAECMERWIARSGPDGRENAVRMIDQTLGLSQDDLWAPKPDFIDRPPYEWSNERLSEAQAVDYHVGKSPENFDTLRERLWSAL